MTDETTNAPGIGAGDGSMPTPPLKLLTQYLKDLSFENPGAPMVHMLRGEVPRAQLSLDVRARTIAPMQYEVSLVLGISAQSVESHDKFSGKHGFKFPLLSDADKAVAGAYGTLGPLGFPRRSVFIVDAGGTIRYVHRAIAGLTYRPVSELVTALKALPTA